ncbi:MAG: hypothetical protein ACREAM_23735 [Blastocatellia bacterium]
MKTQRRATTRQTQLPSPRQTTLTIQNASSATSANRDDDARAKTASNAPMKMLKYSRSPANITISREALAASRPFSEVSASAI